MNIRQWIGGLSVLLLGVTLALLVPVSAPACPFCSAPTLTLTEQFSKADVALLVKWVGGEMPVKESIGSTVYEIVQAPKASFKSLEKGKTLTLERYRAGKKGDLAMLFGSKTKGEVVEWGSPLEVSEAGFKYVAVAPPPEAAPEVRLAYFLNFLEDPDPLVANDAYAEFANAPYKDIVPLSKKFPREKLRKWLTSPNVAATRVGLYGLMLGLIGNPDDAPVMEAKITQNTEEFRLGIDGVMGGYLLLTGDKGLEAIEKSKFADRKVPFSETYSAMQALRFMWTYGNNRISQDRLRASMRLLLDRPELTDLVVADLGRWKDWSIQDKLMKIYGTEEYNVPSIKRAIIRYMIASTKDIPQGGGEKTPQHAADGAKYLQQLREKDPKMVSEAERFFFIQ